MHSQYPTFFLVLLLGDGMPFLRGSPLACLETGPVPAYSRALVGRSGPRDLHKYQVLAPAPPRRYVGVVLLLSDRGEAAVERCWVGGLSSMMGRGVGDREGGEVAAAASSPPSLSVACPFCPSPVACPPRALFYSPYHRRAYLYTL